MTKYNSESEGIQSIKGLADNIIGKYRVGGDTIYRIEQKHNKKNKLFSVKVSRRFENTFESIKWVRSKRDGYWMCSSYLGERKGEARKGTIYLHQIVKEEELKRKQLPKVEKKEEEEIKEKTKWEGHHKNKKKFDNTDENIIVIHWLEHKRLENNISKNINMQDDGNYTVKYYICGNNVTIQDISSIKQCKLFIGVMEYMIFNFKHRLIEVCSEYMINVDSSINYIEDLIRFICKDDGEMQSYNMDINEGGFGTDEILINETIKVYKKYKDKVKEYYKNM